MAEHADTHTRIERILRVAANGLCSCGGCGPADPGACVACRFYHAVRLDLHEVVDAALAQYREVPHA